MNGTTTLRQDRTNRRERTFQERTCPGAVALAAFMLTLLMAALALAIDKSYVPVERPELGPGTGVAAMVALPLK